jgi:hypothetical protein
MDAENLRSLLRPMVGDMKDRCTNANIPEMCVQLGLPVPEDVGSKRDRFHAAFDALDDRGVEDFARGMTSRRQLHPMIRNKVQDILWANEPTAGIPKRHRREIARALQNVELFQHWENFSTLLKDTFVFPEWPMSFIGSGPRGVLSDIHTHFVRNPEAANVEALFDQLHVLDLSDQRFARFLAGLVSSDVQLDAEAQGAMVSAINPTLLSCGAELRPTGEAGGYPVFSVVHVRTARGRPKNLIFASSFKPDIRFRDAIDNDIEIASNPDDVLVYDRPLGVEGLRWRDLQNWWTELTEEADPIQAKNSLYRRLIASLPESSPPQKALFKAFYSSFASAVPDLPALLPEVWLHWDPKTVAERGTSALLTHRMDFLLLMGGGARVVLEVDGAQHYSDNHGLASPSTYARLTESDRELKLSGYEVYRFAGIELLGPKASGVVKDFFEKLFRRHGLSLPKQTHSQTP